jgi:hypothetical protein
MIGFPSERVILNSGHAWKQMSMYIEKHQTERNTQIKVHMKEVDDRIFLIFQKQAVSRTGMNIIY